MTEASIPERWSAQRDTPYWRAMAATIAAECDGEVRDTAALLAESFDQDEIDQLKTYLDWLFEQDDAEEDWQGRAWRYETRTGASWETCPALVECAPRWAA